MTDERIIYGLMAEFDTPQGLLAASHQAFAAGYREIDAYSPFPIEGLSEAIGARRTWLSPLVLAGGAVGAAGGFFLQWYLTVVDFPLNVGGRPLNSWPAYIPISFELMILLAVFSALAGLFVFNRFPQPYHPVFNVEEFGDATDDRFFLAIEADDPRFDPVETRRFLESLAPEGVREVDL